MADSGRLDELQRKFDENPRRYFAPLANEYRKAGRIEQAIELCRVYLPQQPGHMSGYIVYGQTLFDAGRGWESAEIFHRALELDPENVVALRYLGDIARVSGERDEAMRWYDQVLALDPKHEEVLAAVAGLDMVEGESVPELSSEPVLEPAQPTLEPEPAPEPMREPEHVRGLEQTPEPEPAQEAGQAQGQEQAPEPEPETPREVVSEAVFDSAPEVPLEAFSEAPVETPELAASPDVTEPVEPAPVPSQVESPSVEPPAVVPSISEFIMTTDLSAPFVTETMAELYLRQGFTGEALAVYRRLAEGRYDARLRDKVRELEQQLAQEADTPREVPVAIEPASHQEHGPEPETVTVRDFFAQLGARRPQATDAASTVPGSLSTLFGPIHLDAVDTRAATALAGAYTSVR